MCMLLLGQRWPVSKGAYSTLQQVDKGKGKTASTLQRYRVHPEQMPDGTIWAEGPPGLLELWSVHRLAAKPLPETHMPGTELSGVNIRRT